MLCAEEERLRCKRQKVHTQYTIDALIFYYHNFSTSIQFLSEALMCSNSIYNLYVDEMRMESSRSISHR